MQSEPGKLKSPPLISATVFCCRDDKNKDIWEVAVVGTEITEKYKDEDLVTASLKAVTKFMERCLAKEEK